MRAIVQKAVLTGILGLGSAFLVTNVVADDEVCVVNTTETPVTAGSKGSNESQIANSAFCISVSLSNDNETLAHDGQGIWVRGPGNTYVEVDVSDPVIGTLGFTSNGESFGGASIGGGLQMSGPQKGDDGVYRMIIQ